MLIAVPSDNPGGLDAAISEHFGHCEVFTLVQVDGDQLGEVQCLSGGDHAEGGCLAPVKALKDAGVDAMVAGGMGRRPLQGFTEAGMKVYQNQRATTVREAVQGVIDGSLSEFTEQHSCGGHGHGGHGGHHGHGGGCGHHHEHVEREVVHGPVEQGRVVFVSLKVTDEAGELLEQAEGLGMVYGFGSMVPGLERALKGHVAGDTVKVTVAPEDGYGERDEQRLIKAPAENLPSDLKPGEMVQAHLHSGGVARLTLISVEDGVATLDANHPLAGKTLNFEAKILEVQEATEEDLAAAKSG